MDETGGKAIPRLEDEALLRGAAHFVDDIHLPGMLEAAFVRSPHPHALIRGIDADAARALARVHAVYTMTDFRPHVTTDRLVVGLPSPAYRQMVDRPILAESEVVHVGEPVAIVVADDRYLAEDAAALVMVDYEPLAGVSGSTAPVAAAPSPCGSAPPSTGWRPRDLPSATCRAAPRSSKPSTATPGAPCSASPTRAGRRRAHGRAGAPGGRRRPRRPRARTTRDRRRRARTARPC